MRKYLTIGEVANLFSIATSQIRFYEKKGLLNPFLIDDNGYRLFSYEELNILEIIITFRKLNLSIAEIKEILHQKDDYDFLEVLDKTEQKIDEEMMMLKRSLASIRKLRKSYIDFKTDTEKIIQFPKRNLYIVDSDINIVKSEKELYDFIQNYNLDYFDNNYLFYTIISDPVSIGCLYTHNDDVKLTNFPTYQLEEGLYFSHNFNTESSNYSELDKIQQLILQKCRNAGYEPIGNCIIIEDITAYSFSKSKIHMTLQVRVKANE